MHSWPFSGRTRENAVEDAVCENASNIDPTWDRGHRVDYA